MTPIVAVHGVGHHAPAHSPESVVAARSRRWAEDLAQGLGLGPERLDLRYAYYAHHLHAGRPTAQGGADDDADLDRLERDDPTAAALAADWAEALGLPGATAQGRLAIPLRHFAGMVARHLSLDGRLTRAFIATLFRDVARYLGEPTAREAARETVAAAIGDRGARIVIAHSLGSVVTYEALHARPELEVDLLLTLGSPLALPHGVFHRLSPAPEDDVGRRPPGVRRWVNISDHGDPVAVPRPLTRRFPDVDEDLTESISLFDFHTAARYLRSAAVATAVRTHL
ncbi:serine peptidase [Kitasatospora sp. NPDC101155]|uniref:serine peptidase n=1 Tax=Kitasatospora sp. NPDC101155 TaxID=3364097 RepID=UPI003821B431